MRVLVVQADESARASQRALLSGAELTVADAGSGAEALEKLREGPPDLVVLGRSLPDMDGLDLLPQLKGTHDQFTPVLIASHRSATAERVLGLQKGADDYLPLPCDPDELLARVRALLRVKEMHDRVLSIQRELERLVVSDPLTGLYNRRYLVERLGQEMNRVDRYGGKLAFAMIDLDGFKPVNDKYGHVFGDRLLRAVASEISRSLRTPDVAARYGGDEFAVILPQTQPEGALRVCERIRKAVEQLALNAGDAPVSVTATLGAADYPAEGITIAEGLIHAADEALYGAKRAGKNRYSAGRALS
ncbi:MAG TPA: diguanylate cyclase [Myxococcales bacterium]|nr:diguanylate cyclase [Myxococcales bacterium]